MDQRGPGINSTIKECSTLGFADLGDVDGFHEPGSGLFGLLLVKDGHYVRAPAMPQEPAWDVNLTLKASHIFLKPKGAVINHLRSEGWMVVSYAPSGPNRAQVVLEGHSGFYIARTKENAATNVPIQAATTFAKDQETLERPPPNSTIILEIMLGEPSPKKWIEILPNLKIQYDSPMIVALIIKNNKVRSTNSALRTQVTDKAQGEKAQVGCHYFQVEPRIGFIRLLFTTTEVPDSYIEILTTNIDRLNTSITKPVETI